MLKLCGPKLLNSGGSCLLWPSSFDNYEEENFEGYCLFLNLLLEVASFELQTILLDAHALIMCINAISEYIIFSLYRSL